MRKLDTLATLKSVQASRGETFKRSERSKSFFFNLLRCSEDVQVTVYFCLFKTASKAGRRGRFAVEAVNPKKH